MIVNYIKDPFKSTWIGGCNIVSVKDIAGAMLLLGEKRNSRWNVTLRGSDNLEWKQLHGMISPELCGLPGPILRVQSIAYTFITAFP